MSIRVYSQLEKLWEKNGAKEFGKICQILFGFCLLRLRFQIQIFNSIGVPDMVAIRNMEKFAFDAKTQSSSEATISQRTLDGVKEYTDHAIIAVLSYPDLDSSWVLAKADKLKAGRWPVALLKQHSLQPLENEVNEVFPDVLKEYSPLANLGTRVLYDRFNEVLGLSRKRN